MLVVFADIHWHDVADLHWLCNHFSVQWSTESPQKHISIDNTSAITPTRIPKSNEKPIYAALVWCISKHSTLGEISNSTLVLASGTFNSSRGADAGIGGVGFGASTLLVVGSFFWTIQFRDVDGCFGCDWDCFARFCIGDRSQLTHTTVDSAVSHGEQISRREIGEREIFCLSVYIHHCRSFETRMHIRGRDFLFLALLTDRPLIPLISFLLYLLVKQIQWMTFRRLTRGVRKRIGGFLSVIWLVVRRIQREYKLSLWSFAVRGCGDGRRIEINDQIKNV